MFTLSGTVKVKNETQQISEKFKKREFVVTDASGNYPQDISFQLTQERVTQMDDVNQGDMVNVSFFIRGREWTSPAGEVRYFNSLDVWKVEKMGAGAPAPNGEPASASSPETFVEEGDDDLPF
ncbi:protein of unknown function [Lishizhenia tianjinensis]|uniref:DUF3127 domain-containing protein n=1 Tax=Lishizhenia tianjinensis TaxID=477690 RepID=A0A1I7A3G5_9FLAO|nr:DUF3127 domain-containing protein [Lishizhenia tianjinensis]SFT69435.1 protein of unknown function [Lishizhenia tianjinensis]